MQIIFGTIADEKDDSIKRLESYQKLLDKKFDELRQVDLKHV